MSAFFFFNESARRPSLDFALTANPPPRVHKRCRSVMPFKGSLADAADLKALAKLREGPAYDKGPGYKQSAGPTQIVLPPPRADGDGDSNGEEEAVAAPTKTPIPGYPDGSAFVIHNFFTPEECDSIIEQATAQGFVSVNVQGYSNAMRICDRSGPRHR